MFRRGREGSGYQNRVVVKCALTVGTYIEFFFFVVLGSMIICRCTPFTAFNLSQEHPICVAVVDAVVVVDTMLSTAYSSSVARRREKNEISRR